MEPLFDQLKERFQSSPPKPLFLPGVSLRESAVLAPLFVRRGEAHLVFTRRPARLRQHGGQISFPGGARDASDETPLHTALRETQEELGIRPEQVDVLGRLDELPTITEFRIIPFVGAIPADVVYRPSPEEVEEVIVVPLAFFLDPTHRRTERRRTGGGETDIYFYDYGPHVIWGATARIVSNLVAVVGDLPALRAVEGSG